MRKTAYFISFFLIFSYVGIAVDFMVWLWEHRLSDLLPAVSDNRMIKFMLSFGFIGGLIGMWFSGATEDAP